MKYEVYTRLKVTDDFSIIDFASAGKQGIIPKRIAFSPTELNGVFNLAFGDIDKDGEIDDYNVSNNGDRNKILATIAAVAKAYTDRYPDRLILFRGSTIERTRLYRMAIGLNLEELTVDFDIYGYKDGKILPFVKNMETTAFLIKRKII